MEQKKSSTQKQVIEMHQHSQEMKESSSSNYSSEVLEWQKMARKEKVISMSSTQKEQRMISVRRLLHLHACLILLTYLFSFCRTISLPPSLQNH